MRQLKPHKSPRLPAINSVHLEDPKNSENSINLQNEKNLKNPENNKNPEITENLDKIPNIVDTKKIQNIKVEPETAKKKRIRKIRINQDGKVLHLRNHKSALSKYTHNVNFSSILTFRNQVLRMELTYQILQGFRLF